MFSGLGGYGGGKFKRKEFTFYIQEFYIECRMCVHVIITKIIILGINI